MVLPESLPPITGSMLFPPKSSKHAYAHVWNPSWVEDVLLHPSRQSFVCMRPNMAYELRKNIRSALSDFAAVVFLSDDETPPADCRNYTLDWKNKYTGHVKGGLGLFGRTYLIGGTVHATLKSFLVEHDCSVTGWNKVSESDFNGPKSYICKDNPAEVFFSDLAGRLAYKLSLRVRKVVLEDMGYPVSKELVEADEEMAREMKGW